MNTSLQINLFVRLLLLVALMLGTALPLTPAYGADIVRIGVLAFRPKPQTVAQWQPLAAVLKQAMPEHDFTVQALSYPELNDAVARRQLDFVLTNPGHYVLLTKRGGVSAPLATLAANDHGQSSTVFGGVIFSRAEQSAIDTLGDIKGKSIAITSIDSLGGYQMQAYELKLAGIKLPQDVKLMPVGMPHDNVVNAVLAGQADVGFVRSGVLEDLVQEGKLDMAQIKILNPQYLPGFPVHISTRLYPEWPFAALPQTDEKLARHVTAALFLLEKDTAALRAMHIFGFTIPADYMPVVNLLKELRLPPFDMIPDFNLTDLWHKYTAWIVAIFMLGLLLAGAGANLLLQNRRIRQGEQRFAMLFEHSPEAMWIMADRRFIGCNAAAARMFGFLDAASVLGLSPLDISPEQQPDGEASAVKAERLLQTVEKGRVQSFEWHHLKLDGEKITCFIKLVPAQLDGKQVVLCSGQDISVRKRMETALRESEYRWKFAVEGSGDGLWDWDIANNTVFFSKRWKGMIGFGDNELHNHFEAWEQRIHADDKAVVSATLQAYFDGKIPVYSIEHRLLCKDGHYKWVLARGIVVSRDAEGKPLRMIGTHTDISERRKLEDELRDSNAFNVSILDSLTAQIAVLDAQGVIVAVNKAWRQFAQDNAMPEFSRDMQGVNYLEACDGSYGDESNSARSGILAVLTGEQDSFLLEYPCHSPDEQRWFQMNVSPLQGSRQGVVVSHENITERLQHEHKLGLFHSLFEMASDCMFLISAKQDSRFVFVNDSTCRHFGVTREQLLQWRIPDWDPNFKTEADLEAVWQQIKAEKGFVLETVHCLASGREVPVELSVSYLAYNDDEYMAGYFHDISERKRAEHELKASEAKFRSIIEASPVPMVLNDDQLNITFLNQAFVQTFGYTLADIPTLSAWWQKAYPDPEYRQWVESTWQSELEQAKQEQAEFAPLELAICCKDNSIKTAMVTAAALNYDFTGVHVVILYDISERKQIEAELTRSNAELEQFAYAVSHDMRQPLRMVSSYLALIESALAGKLDEETRQCLDFALNGAKRMDAMILSLLEYSRIGRVCEDKTRLSSKVALDEALAFLQPEISACGGAVKVSGDWSELFASPDELTRLLQNLIGNALKYHPEDRPPQVDIHGEVRGIVLRVAVRDQGIGIDPSQINRLFKVFSRLQARSRFEGTGVGLALCRKIVEHHGGSIGVESAGEGQGCMFWFELPL
ncbi:MAG: PAS domain S-box protein [Methylobacter sp.]|nr:PAS domain S-box protein [Methylobacter sp.]